MTDIDWDEIHARIEKAKQAPEFSDAEPETEVEPETYDQLRKRMFEGHDLPDIATRMFRH